jgi:hypothetical protein
MSTSIRIVLSILFKFTFIFGIFILLWIKSKNWITDHWYSDFLLAFSMVIATELYSYFIRPFFIKKS